MDFLHIKPLDTLFFRNGKPFDAGNDSWSDSSMLPNPSTIWGAMFGVLFDEGKVNTNDREKLKITNIYLYNEKQQVVLVPAPFDIFVDNDGFIHKGEYKDAKGDFISNYPLEVVNIVEDKEVKPIENSFIEIGSLYRHYANGYFKNLILYDFNEVFLPDYKIGIKIDRKTKTAQENFLYRIDLTQFKKDWSFLIEYESEVEFSNSGVLKFGGEGKRAEFKRIEKMPIALESAKKYKKKIDEDLKNRKFVKIYFKTPVFFKNGWKPNKDGLVCANVGKPISIGGYDMEQKTPKEMKKYVPAGSVYIFRKSGEFNLESEDSEVYKGFGLYEQLPI